jgi:hypothetical protein
MTKHINQRDLRNSFHVCFTQFLKHASLFVTESELRVRLFWALQASTTYEGRVVLTICGQNEQT